MTAIPSPLAIEVLFVEYGNTETIEPADLKPYVEAGGGELEVSKGFNWEKVLAQLMTEATTAMLMVPPKILQTVACVCFILYTPSARTMPLFAWRFLACSLVLVPHFHSLSRSHRCTHNIACAHLRAFLLMLHANPQLL